MSGIGGIFPALVLARSYNDSNTNGGVAYANANNDASNTNSNYGSRLIFRRKNRYLCSSWRGRVPMPTYRKMSLAPWQKTNLGCVMW